MNIILKGERKMKLTKFKEDYKKECKCRFCKKTKDVELFKSNETCIMCFNKKIERNDKRLKEMIKG